MSAIEKLIEEREIHFIPAVVGFALKDHEVLLGVRKKSSLGLGENLLAGIGGKVGDEVGFENETFEQAMVREAREEIGIEIKTLVDMGRVRFVFPHKPKWNLDTRVYQIHHWEGEPVETDAIKPLWYPKDQLPNEQMWKDNALWVPKILMNEKINVLFIYNEENEVVEYLFE